MGENGIRYRVGLDVGSTTIKAVVVEADTHRTVWRDYQRHETRQAEKVLEFLQRMEAEVGLVPANGRIFITGSGGHTFAGLTGARYVQEVNAVCLAAEKYHPEAHTVIELGGQDAKIILFKEGEEKGRRKKVLSMNDKCAGGTGAVIDKISAKLSLAPAAVSALRYTGLPVHPVAGKCGVFAETDITSLQKQGIPPEELMASLFEAIVLQNLTVLTRGHTPHPHVLLLGGPHAFVPGLCEAWQHHLPRLWRERQVELAGAARPEELIEVADGAEYFAALGAAEFGRDEAEEVGRYRGLEGLQHYIDVGREEEKAQAGSRGLYASPAELTAFLERYASPQGPGAIFLPGQRVRGLIGLDAGSTSTKAVFLSEQGEVLSTAYQLSKGNPIQDTIEVFEALRKPVESRGARLDVLGVGVTGYAKDILKEALQADLALPETVAHAEAAMRFYPHPHVIVDVGGQDIKLIVLKDGRVKDFKLNTQCSAGNGYFLQATAESFGVPVERYADLAFTAQAMPVFGYGCVVFLQTDIVNSQRQGWQPGEILAGLAAVLSKNVFLYVAKMPNLARLGTRFILQGGTQKNLAVVKAEVDFISSHFRGTDRRPEVIVHKHCAECGAIGAAWEALRLRHNGRRTTFIGLDAVRSLSYRTTRNEDTRCDFCKNACARTFIDIQMGRVEREGPRHRSKVPLQAGERRLIVATCEKGAVEDRGEMQGIKAGVEAVKAVNPNFLAIAAREVWRPRRPETVADAIPARAWTKAVRQRVALMKTRVRLRVGIPRILYMYAYAPLFSAYLESLGVAAENIVYSDFTSNEMYRTGCRRGAIDPCFPCKIALAHLDNLIRVKHRQKPLHCIFFPMFDVLPSPLVKTLGSNACPAISLTPQTLKAAYTLETDLFAAHALRYMHPLLNLSDRELFARQMFQAWAPALGLSPAENERAVAAGFAALEEFERGIRKRARSVLDQLERENRLGIVILGRPYHHDPGINHQIPEEFQKLGYPVFSPSTLPCDEDLLERLFGEEVRAGMIGHPLDISDVWKNAYSASSNQKLWAAKFTARHPNLVALEISSFKCGHDAPIYSVIEDIIERSGTPYACFKDLDENRPANSIRLRVETFHYFLKRHAAELPSPRQAGAAERPRRHAGRTPSPESEAEERVGA